MDVLSTVEPFAWILWLLLILGFLVIDLLRVGRTFLWLASGGMVGLVASLGGAPLWMQVSVATLAVIVLVSLLRPTVLHRRRSSAATAPPDGTRDSADSPRTAPVDS